MREHARGRGRLAWLLWIGLLLLGTALAAAESVPLTPAEREFLAGRTLRIGVDSARPPFEFIDAQGTYSGISAGFMLACARRLGVKVQVVPGLPVAQAIARLEAGEIDVIPKITPTPERRDHLLFTAPYNSFPSVIVTRKEARAVAGLEDLAGLKIGVARGLVVEELLRRDRPGMPLVGTANVQEGLLQLSTGGLDAFIDNLGTVTYGIDSLGLTNLKIAAPTPYTHDLAFGVRKDMPLLHSALEKALASLSVQERAAIKNAWLGASGPRGVPWATMAPYLAAAVLLALFLFLRIRSLRKAVLERQRVQEELEAHAHLLESQAHLKSCMTALSVELQKAQTLPELAQACFVRLAPLAGLASGALHILDAEQGVLAFAGGYGRTGREADSRSFVLGHGLVGQCAQDLQPITLADPGGLPFQAVAGLGQVVLRELRVLPLQRMERVLGVVSLGTPTHFSEAQLRLVDEALPLVALNLEILAGNLETRQLLERSRIQTQILYDAEQKSRTLLDALSVGLLLVEPRRGLVTDANPTALRMTGNLREEFIGVRCRATGCPYARGTCPALDRGERIEHEEGFLSDAEGGRLPVLRNVVPVVLGGQNFLLESLVDISAQKALEHQLRESGERLEIASNALAQSPASVMITGIDGSIEYVNPKFERTSGYALDELLGRNPRLLKSGVHGPEIYQALWSTILAGGEWHGEICNRRKDGGLYWEQASIFPVRGDGDRVTHFVSIKEDITERRRLDEALKAHVDELERFTRLTVDREERMIELKREINALLAETGRPGRYTIVE